MNYKIAVSIAYLASVLTHFIANRRFTFQSHGHNLWPHIAKYCSLVVINYLITLAVVHIIVVELFLSPYLGIVGSIIATVLVGFLLAKLWVFT